MTRQSRKALHHSVIPTHPLPADRGLLLGSCTNDHHVLSSRHKSLSRGKLEQDQSKASPMGGETYFLMSMAVSHNTQQGYQRAELVTAEELSLIKRVDKQPKARTESVLISEGGTYPLLYLSLLKKLQRIDTMQCLLVLIADALAGMLRSHSWLTSAIY